MLSTIESNTQYCGRDLDAFLHLNNLQRIKIPGDGNCFFVSLATMIQQQLAKGSLNPEEKTHMENLGLIKDANTDIKQMATALRQTIVNKWLANPSSYEPFLTSGQDYKSEANAFLQDGYFASELGNSMPLAASNVLCISAVVFPAMLNFPVLPICPRDRTLSDNPIYLAYDMSFAGHYDGIEQQSTPQQGEQKQRSLPTQCGNKQQITCRCGQGMKRKKMGSISCNEYKSGCKCFQNVMGCNMYCQCINCSNPRGKKASSDSAPLTCSARKRRHHDNSTEGLSGKSFTESKAGGTMTVHWTLIEELVLMELVLALLASDKLETESVFKEYNHVVDTVRPTDIKHCLGKKQRDKWLISFQNC